MGMEKVAALLELSCEREAESIARWMRHTLRDVLKRRGVVVGVSGGIDSSVTAALAVRALGRERVFALEMPEQCSAEETVRLSAALIAHLGVDSARIDISPVLEALGAYRQYDEAVRMVLPEYGEGWKSKVVISDVFARRGFSQSSVVAQAPDGTVHKRRLPFKPYLELGAATNFKQRTRKMLEYHHADRLNYAVAGTPNRLEYDQGFFVKLGDGAADLKPIAHLYKSQVYQLAAYLGIPEEIRRRPPTTDTYSLPQGQDEFYFSLPYQLMDLCLYGRNQGISPQEIAAGSGLSADEVQRVYEDIEVKRATTRYLHQQAVLMHEVAEIGATPGQAGGPERLPVRGAQGTEVSG